MGDNRKQAVQEDGYQTDRCGGSREGYRGSCGGQGGGRSAVHRYKTIQESGEKIQTRKASDKAQLP